MRTIMKMLTVLSGGGVDYAQLMAASGYWHRLTESDHPDGSGVFGVVGINSNYAGGEGVDLLGGAGAFASGTGWTAGSGWSIGSGVATYDDTINANLSHAISAAIALGNTYRARFDTGGNTADLRLRDADNASNTWLAVPTPVYAIGSHDVRVVCPLAVPSNINVRGQTGSGGAFTLDNLLITKYGEFDIALAGGITFSQTGLFGANHAYLLDGSTGVGTIYNRAEIQGMTAFTLMQLIQPASLTDGDYLWFKLDEIEVWVNADGSIFARAHYDTTDAETLSIAGAIGINDWFAVHVVLESDSLTIYSNGVNVDSTVQAGVGTRISNTNNLQLWKNASTNAFDGLVDEIKLDTDAKSASYVGSVVAAMPPFSVAWTISRLVLYDNIGTDDWYGRIRLTQLADGTVVGCLRSGDSHLPQTDAQIHVFFADETGQTFSALNTTLAAAPVTGMPVTSPVAEKSLTDCVMVLAPNGDLLLLSFSRAGGGINQWRSTDDGASWAYEGVINSDTTLVQEDFQVVGSNIYAVFRYDPGSDFNHPHYLHFYKSEDSGVTWVLVTAIEATLDCNEAGLLYLGGNVFQVYVRDDSEVDTFRYTSGADLGATWGARETVTSTFGVLQRPVCKSFGGRHWLFGRQAVTGDDRTVLYWSADGLSWSAPFYPSGDTAYADTAYADIFPAPDGTICVVTYEGTTANADTVRYFVRIL